MPGVIAAAKCGQGIIEADQRGARCLKGRAEQRDRLLQVAGFGGQGPGEAVEVLDEALEVAFAFVQLARDTAEAPDQVAEVVRLLAEEGGVDYGRALRGGGALAVGEVQCLSTTQALDHRFEGQVLFGGRLGVEAGAETVEQLLDVGALGKLQGGQDLVDLDGHLGV